MSCPAPSVPTPPPTGPCRPTAIGLAARWVGVTNLALVGLILLVAFGEGLGRWPVVASSALLSAAWAGASVGLLQAWRHPAAPTATSVSGNGVAARAAGRQPPRR